jgi:hypothetical protein
MPSPTLKFDARCTAQKERSKIAHASTDDSFDRGMLTYA